MSEEITMPDWLKKRLDIYIGLLESDIHGEKELAERKAFKKCYELLQDRILEWRPIETLDKCKLVLLYLDGSWVEGELNLMNEIEYTVFGETHVCLKEHVSHWSPLPKIKENK